MEEYIDTRGTEQEYQCTLRRVFESNDVSDRNKELLRRFLRDCQLGKTNRGSSRRRIGKARQSALLRRLMVPMLYWNKNLDAITQENMESFVMDLETDKIFSRNKGLPLSPTYQANVKGAVRKFYKWLYGNSKAYPELVDWIDAKEPRVETAHRGRSCPTH